MHAHFALEILHDVQEVVVHVRLVLELDLDRVEVGERVGDIERATETVWSARGHWRTGMSSKMGDEEQLAVGIIHVVPMTRRLCGGFSVHPRQKCLPEEAKDSTSRPSSPTTSSCSPPSLPSYVYFSLPNTPRVSLRLNSWHGSSRSYPRL